MGFRNMIANNRWKSLKVNDSFESRNDFTYKIVDIFDHCIFVDIYKNGTVAPRFRNLKILKATFKENVKNGIYINFTNNHPIGHKPQQVEKQITENIKRMEDEEAVINVVVKVRDISTLKEVLNKLSSFIDQKDDNLRASISLMTQK